MLEIMREYGWDFHTFMRQPTWIVELASRKMGLEAKLAQQAADAAKTQ